MKIASAMVSFHLKDVSIRRHVISILMPLSMMEHANILAMRAMMVILALTMTFGQTIASAREYLLLMMIVR